MERNIEFMINVSLIVFCLYLAGCNPSLDIEKESFVIRNNIQKLATKIADGNQIHSSAINEGGEKTKQYRNRT